MIYKIKMANLSNKLQDYLSKSSKSSSNGSNGGQTSSGSYFDYFRNDASKNSSQGVTEDPTNSWFSDAQKDPCLPSLVGVGCFNNPSVGCWHIFFVMMTHLPKKSRSDYFDSLSG